MVLLIGRLSDSTTMIFHGMTIASVTESHLDVPSALRRLYFRAWRHISRIPTLHLILKNLGLIMLVLLLSTTRRWPTKGTVANKPQNLMLYTSLPEIVLNLLFVLPNEISSAPNVMNFLSQPPLALSGTLLRIFVVTLLLPLFLLFSALMAL